MRLIDILLSFFGFEKDSAKDKVYSLYEARIHFVCNPNEPALCVSPEGARYTARNLHDAYEFFEEVL